MNILLFSKQIHKNEAIKKLSNHSVREGFLLIELMVSITLFIFFIYLLHMYLSITHELSVESIKRQEVLTILESFINDVKYNASLLQQKKFEKNDCTITWNQKPFPIQQSGFLKLAVSNCQRVFFKASWKGKNNAIKNIEIITGVVI